MRTRATKHLRLIIGAILVLSATMPALAAAQPAQQDVPLGQRWLLRRVAVDTWKSFAAMVDYRTGLPSDNISAGFERSGYTSPTNIGTYIWSTIAARDLGIITPGTALWRIGQTLDTLGRIERYEGDANGGRCAGQYYNWYDPTTGAKLTTWPVDQSTVYPFLSSVDNGWLAAALMMVTKAVPLLRDRAQALVSEMDFGCYYDPTTGLIRGGYWPETPIGGVSTPEVGPTQCSPTRQPGSAPVGGFTCHHYGAFNTEPRIASYIGIAMDDIPVEHYFRPWRTFPETCDWGWPEMDPDGVMRSYIGVNVFEGHYRYRSMRIVPSWGGSMFEALMVPLLVPEEEWGPFSWGINHPLYVQAQIEHGLEEADYGYWGFSPSNNPDGGYREYGVDAIGMEPNGYASDQERTFVDYGFRTPDGTGSCPGRETQWIPTEYGRGVVTPHAAFLALDFAPQAAMDNLLKLRRDFPRSYGWGGFFDAIEVETGTISRYYLALDQGMIMAAISNELAGNNMQRYFSSGAVESAVRPLMALEEFTAGRE